MSIRDPQAVMDGLQKKLAAVRERVAELSAEPDLTEGQDRELQDLIRAGEKYRAKIEELRDERIADINRLLREGKATRTPGAGPDVFVSRAPGDPWNESGDVRDRARFAAERYEDVTDEVRGRIVEIVDHDRDTFMSPAAHWALATSDPAYRSAFRKLLRDPMNGHRQFDERELEAFRRAEMVRSLVVGTNTGGGFLVPTHLDPSILLTSAGSVNALRQVARVVTLTDGNVWNGVTSAGVTASWDAELAEVSDDSPTVDRVSVPVHKAAAFVAASFEAFQDTDIDMQVAALFADAKDRLEGTAFNTGSGAGQPTGIWTALDANTNVELQTTTAATIGEVDIHATYDMLPARFRRRASWHMNPKWALEVKRLGANLGSSFSGDLTEAPLRDILGRPVVIDDDAPETVTTTVRDNRIVFGDFNNYIIVDRIGATVEFIPHLFGASGRPIGARGWYYYWRTGADSVLDTAFVLLQDRTSA